MVERGALLTWPSRLWRYRAGRILAWLLVVGFLGYHVQLAARAALPVPAAYKKSWPWAMFKSYSRWHRIIKAYGEVGDDVWEEIALDDFFGYRRGATDLAFYDHANAMRGGDGWKAQARREFAEWVAQKSLDENGKRYRQIRLRRDGVNVDNNKTATDKLGTFPITWQGDRVIPKKARGRPAPFWRKK